MFCTSPVGIRGAKKKATRKRERLESLDGAELHIELHTNYWSLPKFGILIKIPHLHLASNFAIREREKEGKSVVLFCEHTEIKKINPSRELRNGR